MRLERAGKQSTGATFIIPRFPELSSLGVGSVPSLNIRRYLDTAATAMKRRFSKALTLRLDPQMDELVTEAAYNRRSSKATWIRAAIRHSLANELTGKSRQRETPC
jgi:hypothetical protein